MELIAASCVCGYHVYGKNWIAALREELYCKRNVINRYAVAVKLTMQFAAAVAHDGIELKSVPLGLGKVLLCFKIRGGLSKTLKTHAK